MEWGIELKKNNNKKKNSFAMLKQRLFLYFLGIGLGANLLVFLNYKFFFFGRIGEVVIRFMELSLKVDYNTAVNLYQQIFRNWWDVYYTGAIILVALLLTKVVLNKFIRYMEQICSGISSIVNEDEEIHLPEELSEIERNLLDVQNELKKKSLEAKLAEERKNDLVMYLAHDIRTPLTSVIGYLSLLDEIPDMPAGQRAKYVGITLDKAYRLDKMVNEFFEISRYNMQQIDIVKEKVDLYYMLIQLSDELKPVLDSNGNNVVIDCDENMVISADSEKLARVFNNILKNAAAYSYSNSEIRIVVKKTEKFMIIRFENKGKTIPERQMEKIFEKFYRADDARETDKGGSGLGLAIAKEIVLLHGGTITAESKNNIIAFEVSLPIEP